MIYPSQITSVLFFTPPPPPRTLLCSVLLWACASALQTLLKSLFGLTLPASFFHQLPSAFSSPFSSFLLDLPRTFTILCPQEMLLLSLLSSYICCCSLNPFMIISCLISIPCFHLVSYQICQSQFFNYFVWIWWGQKMPQVIARYLWNNMLFVFSFSSFFFYKYMYILLLVLHLKLIC